MASQEELSEYFHLNSLTLDCFSPPSPLTLLTFRSFHLVAQFHYLACHTHVRISTCTLGHWCTNHSKWLDLANCITVSRPRKPTAIKVSTNPKEPKEPRAPRAPKKPTPATDCTEPPKPKHVATKKAAKGPDRKILVAVDLWVKSH